MEWLRQLALYPELQLDSLSLQFKATIVGLCSLHLTVSWEDMLRITSVNTQKQVGEPWPSV